jgi:hypothetical protein
VPPLAVAVMRTGTPARTGNDASERAVIVASLSVTISGAEFSTTS